MHRRNLLPSFLLVLFAAPPLMRHRGNPLVQGFVKAVYAIAIGAILGATLLLGWNAIGDWVRSSSRGEPCRPDPLQNLQSDRRWRLGSGRLGGVSFTQPGLVLLRWPPAGALADPFPPD